MTMPPEPNRHAPRLHAARVIALTAAAWVHGAALAQAYWDPFASPEVSEARDAPQEAAPPAAGPVDAATIGRLLGEAEAAYSAGRWAQAMEAFKAVTAFDAGNAQAWLRIGNLHHRRSQLLAAASAYRKAAGVPPDKAPVAVHAAETRARSGPRTASTVRPASMASTELRTKALVNLASVNLELALAALDEADAAVAGIDEMPAALRSAQGDAKAEAAAIARRIDAVGSDRAVRERGPGDALRGTHRDANHDVNRDQPASTRSGVRNREQGAAGAGSRPGSPSASARETPPAPDTARPTIEYLRGAPRP